MSNINEILPLLDAYIEENYKPQSLLSKIVDKIVPRRKKKPKKNVLDRIARYVLGKFPVSGDLPCTMRADPSMIDFIKLRAEKSAETFSEMLMRLIRESGENNSVIYKRANIDRRHFSKILNHKDYQPSKQTVLAFAIALCLDFGTTNELLASAGFTLTTANLADVIVSFFIECQNFDLFTVNEALHKYKQPLLGG